MSDDKISTTESIDAALHLDGDPKKVRAFYEDWARNYNLDTTSSDYTGPVIAAKLLQQNLPDPASLLLDAGCGTGMVGVELQALGYSRIDGFDLSESMTELAAASGAYRDLLGGIDMLRASDSYADETYDAILSVGVFTLGHVPPEALLVLLQLARSQGLVLVSTRTHYYDQTNFQQVVDELIATGRAELVQLVKNAPYTNDGNGHYWVLRKTG